GLARFYTPTSAFAMLHTDRARTVQPALFERIYDRDMHVRFPHAQRAGDWWVVDTKHLAGTVLMADKGEERIGDENTLCICHDVERGLGHVGIDPDFVRIANDMSPNSLDEMLAVERDANIRASYNVVGIFLNEVRSRIESGRHCIAFHSFDHQI